MPAENLKLRGAMLIRTVNALAAGERSDVAGRGNENESLKRFERADRGLWRFLTWSFFLPPVWPVDPLFESGAKAASDEQDESVKHSSDHSSSPVAKETDTVASVVIGMNAEDPSDESAVLKAKAYAVSHHNNVPQLGEAKSFNSSSGDSGTPGDAGNGGGGGGGGGGAEGGGGGDGGGGDGGGELNFGSLGSNVSQILDNNTVRVDLTLGQIFDNNTGVGTNPILGIDLSRVGLPADVSLGSVGDLVRVDLSLGGELNLGSLGSDLSQVLDNNTGVGSNPILGIDLTRLGLGGLGSVGTAGELVCVYLSLGGELNLGSLGSDLSQILDNNTGVGSNPILGIDLSRLGLGGLGSVGTAG